MEQTALFDVAPSHLYVVAHWQRHGWVLTVHTTTGLVPGASGSTREAYGPLSAAELLDVVSGSLASILKI